MEVLIGTLSLADYISFSYCVKPVAKTQNTIKMEIGQSKGLIKGLETWAKKVTAGYRDVNVRDMSSSFRDGLAFCAIIHHHRPDLIDFESLSKENILQNNSLAFSTAEKQLGVPALLDAEDMVKYARPDRLSIITYLSQLHNCFVHQNKVKTLKPGVRIRQISTEGPPAKIPTAAPNLLAAKRHEVCHACNHRVFILERLMVDGKLYHTTCFRCNKCNSLLNPGAYVESDTVGFYECAVCLPDESSSNMETQDSESNDSGDRYNSLKDTPNPSPLTQRNVPSKNSPLTESVTHARSSFLQNSLSVKPSEVKKDSPVTEKDSTFLRKDSPSFLRKDSPVLKNDSPVLKNDSPSFLRKDSPSFQKTNSPSFFRNSMSSIEGLESSLKSESVDGGLSVKDKISAFESNRNSRTESIFKSAELTSSTKKFSTASTDAEALPLNKSKISATQSPSSPNTVDSLEKPAKPLSPFSSSIANASDVRILPKTALNTDTQSLESSSNDNSLQTDKQNCDSSTQVLLRNKVPSPAHVRRSLQFHSMSNDMDKSKDSTRPFQIGEYKSPLKTSRDIFQNNIQPLKLNIPTIGSSSKREAMIVPSNSLKTAEISLIRPDFAKTLPRQTSAGNLIGKEKTSEANSDSNSTDVSALKWNRTVPRRSSLESQNHDTPLPSVRLKDSLQKEESKSLTEMNLESALSILKTSSAVGETKQDSNTRDTVSPFSMRINDIPIPKVRRSLELKRNLNNSETTGVDALSQSSVSVPSQLAQDKSIVSEVRSDKVSEQTATPEKVPESADSKTEEVQITSPKIVYPVDLNPFGDDMEEEVEYPDDLNPFGDDEEAAPNVDSSSTKTVTADDYDESKNPFASDDDDVDTSTPIKMKPVSPKPVMPASSPFSKPNSTYTSPTGSLRGTTKKRLAPKPPKLSDIFPQSQDSEGDISISSIKSSPSPSVDRKSLHTPSPKVRRNKPTAPPPPIPTGRQTSQTDLAASAKQMKEADNLKIKSTSGDVKDASKAAPKKKKRPAPPVPIPKRLDNKKIPLKDILKEMKEIEEKQRECERQGRELELLIRDKDKDEEPSIEEEEYIMQLFELVNQKNALFRRQAELMYIKRSQRLEEQQAEIQNQIRELLMKPAEEKTEDDKAKEEMLILELKDIVDQRSSIIDSIEMDRRRELEEDASVQEQLEQKNGDLPITAEIKEKSSGKEKKSKAKKEKKEKKEKKSKKKEK